ncbi:hypothetical protein GGR54DRAFT_596733 [Hypoxylon sp. NC1633]|nr:hypothetical protein GGR54DRAFT_596733 [Hypoxylon sp. NC1633]
MADEDILDRVHALADLDLAALLCLISREHCIVTTEPADLDTLIRELQLVASQTFALRSAVVDCTPHTTLDDLAAAIQIQLPPQPQPQPQSLSPGHHRHNSNTTASLRTPSASPLRRRTPESSSYFQHTRQGSHGTSAAAVPPPPPPQMANVILAKNLDRAPVDVQIQCLELLRTRRILTRTSVQTAPKQFLFVAVLESAGISAGAGTGVEGGAGAGAGAGRGSRGRLVSHLNDFFYVSHWHDPEDGFVHLEEVEGDGAEDGELGIKSRDSGRAGDGEAAEEGDGDTASLDSASSVVRRSVSEVIPALPATGTLRGPRSRNAETTQPEGRFHDAASISGSSYRTSPTPPQPLSESAIACLAQLAWQVTTDVEVFRYQLNIVSFIRMHRAVAPGGSSAPPLATKHFAQLSKCLAALHGLDYVTPALVALAARKIYAHRIRVVMPERERSMQWGSDLAAVEALLDGVGPEDVIEDVLGSVAAPL